MIEIKSFRSKKTAAAVLCLFLLLLSPNRMFSQIGPAVSGNGALVGFVYVKDVKMPVSNAVVKLRNAESGKEYASDPTDDTGMYTFPEIPAGTYVMGVTSDGKDYNFNYALVLKEGEMAKLSVALNPVPQEETSPEDTPAKTSFFKTPWGIATIVVTAGVLIFALLSEGEKSPIR